MPRLITVEPVLVGTMVFFMMYATISREYIYHYLSKVHGLANETRTTECNTTEISPAEKELQDKVSAEAGEWGLYLNVAGFVPSMIITPLTASWGDVVGRRYPIILSSFGFLVLGIVYLLVFSYEFSLYILLFGRIFSGLCGDFPGMLASGFAYLSDISSYSKRTTKVAIGEFSLAFGSLLSSLVSGVWVDAQGYSVPMWFLISMMITSILYSTFVLQETVVLESDSIFLWKLRHLFTLKPFQRVWNLLKLDKQRTVNILVVMFCFFLHVCCLTGINNVLPIIQLSPPLCFSNALVGYVTACYTGGFSLGIVIMKLLKYAVSEIWITFIAAMTIIVSMLTLAFANSFWLFILGVSIACPKTMEAVVFRSFVSRLVDPDEQGAVFSLIACAESFSGLVAAFIFNGVYVATVSTYSSAVMFVAILFVITIFSVFRIFYNRLQNAIQENADRKYSQITEDLGTVSA